MVKTSPRPAPPRIPSAAAVEAFRRLGHAGPFDCDAPGLDELPARVLAARFGTGDATLAYDRHGVSAGSESPINVLDPHRDVAAVRAVIEHPSIVDRVAALCGTRELRYFQSRFRVKLGRDDDVVEWHQDVGPRNGGCYADGRPIPTVTVWLSIEGATREDGCVLALPGTHGELLGAWRQGYHAGIEAGGDLRGRDLGQAVALETGPGQFQCFHSWLVHTSAPNTTRRKRTGLVVRFVRPADAIDPGIEYFPCRASEAAVT